MKKFDFREELGKITPLIANGANLYIFGTGANWHSTCKMYERLVGVDLSEHIDGFIDNDVNKQGTILQGKRIYALSEIDINNSVIIISVAIFKSHLEILKQLLDLGMISRHSVFFSDCFFSLLMRWEYARLTKFKDKHKNERCFIIGNGPSLRPRDLDKLKNEITFASNKIYLMFDKTAWRPSYYMILDDEALRQAHRHLGDIACPKFFDVNSVLCLENFSLTNEYFYYTEPTNNWCPDGVFRFSEHPHVLCMGETVVYICLQMAVYMGFKKIYLLGIDNSYPLSLNDKGEIVREPGNCHFYNTSSKIVCHTPLFERMTNAFVSAKKYVDSHDIKIYNATRGGKLEVFERVDFDSLFIHTVGAG